MFRASTCLRNAIGKGWIVYFSDEIWGYICIGIEIGAIA